MKKQERYTIWVVYTPGSVSWIVPVDIRESRRRAKVLTNHCAFWGCEFLPLSDPRLGHRTRKAAIKYWHKQNAKRLAYLENEIAEEERLDRTAPVVGVAPHVVGAPPSRKP